MGAASIELPNSLDELKSRVDGLGQASDWESAVQLCEGYLRTTRDIQTEAYGLLGDCRYQLAFQQGTRDAFKEEILRAREAYSQAGDKRSMARNAFCSHWVSDDLEERRNIIMGECIPLGREATMENSEAARPRAELLIYLSSGCAIASDRTELLKLADEAKRVGDEAFSRFCKGRKGNESDAVLVGNAYSQFLFIASGNMIDENESARISSEIAPVLISMAQNPKGAGLMRSLTYETAGFMAFEFLGDPPMAEGLFDKALTEGESTRDRYVIGRQQWASCNAKIWKSLGIDVPESKVELLKEISSRDERAIENLSICLAGFSLNFAYGDCIQSLTDRADYSRDTSEKLELLDRAIELGREGMKYLGLNTLQPEVPWRLAVALHGKANLAGSKVERERLHSEAVSAVRGDLESMKRLIDPGSWNIGITSGRLGTALRHLSDDQEHSSQERQAHLEESAHYLALAVETTSKAAGAQTKSRMQRIGAIAEELGNTMQELSSLTGKREDALRTAKAFEQAIAYYSVQSLNGLMAPLEWKVAKIYDSIEDYDYSSNAFRRAGEQYETAAKGQKSLQKEFTELSYYMQAWSNIEEARVLHKDEDYLSSADKLKGSSKLLERTDSFRYLSEFYLASSKVEEAEDLSRKEKSEEAAEAFGAAAELYGQAEKNAASHGESGGSAGLSRSRQGYCLARRSLEEAKVLDMAGQAQASMRKYRQAAEAFGRLESETRGEDKGELEALSLSCVAWATMKEGEYSSSSELYYRAAQLFLEAKEKKVRQSFVLSCLANASMCEALAAGTNFKRSSDVNLYSEIKTKLGAASRYYEEAGFEIASDWTRATEALFDSLAYLAGAEREIDPQKKTQMYQLAEKHLELSARRYGDIGFDKKRQEVLRHLKTARENRELLLTPIEALSQSPTVAATPVTFTRDQAVGLERFEAAKLTGSFGVSATSSDIGSELRLDIDFANVGKAPALLMKLNNVAPSDAFEPEEGKNTLQFSTGAGTLSIDLKGRRLEYLKAHQVSIYLKAKSKGTFELSPKVVFVDEMGKYRSFDYEPQAVVIGEPPGQPQQGERRLAAIMFTDMVGYTALTQSNESLAMEVLQRHNRLIRPFFPRFHGREVKTIGDSFLAEFDSALDALKCAVELQSFLHDYNISSRDEWRIKLRVGIHLGDVIHQQGDVLGDAVNIASRIEPTAEPEGVCVSAQVYDQVHNKFERPLVSLGERTLKNVSGDVEVFKVMMPWE